MSDNILILGKGFIGSRLKDAFGCEVSEKIIQSYSDADSEIKKFNPAVIVNCIGHIGANVDECEKDVERTLWANSFLPLILAEIAVRNNIRLVHISSGCIFHYDYASDEPIKEERAPDFFELFYSRTKIYADQALLALSRRHPVLIARIRVPLDDRPHPRNILTKLVKYRKIIDLPNSITYIPDFILALRHLIKIEAAGIYNLVNKNPLRYPELLDIYKKYAPDFSYQVIDYKQLNLVRTNLILSTDKLEKAGFKVREIQEVLVECVKNYLKY